MYRLGRRGRAGGERRRAGLTGPPPSLCTVSRCSRLGLSLLYILPVTSSLTDPSHSVYLFTSHTHISPLPRHSPLPAPQSEPLPHKHTICSPRLRAGRTPAISSASPAPQTHYHSPPTSSSRTWRTLPSGTSPPVLLFRLSLPSLVCNTVVSTV